MWNYTEADLDAGRKAFGGGTVGAALPLLVDHAKGCMVYDGSGKEYIDCTAQAWSLTVGHCHPKVTAAVTEGLQNYSHLRTSFETIPKLLLSKKLSELGPGNLKLVSYTMTGSEANEGAIKLAMRNRPGNTMVSLMDGYHGRSLATLNLSWPHPNNRFAVWGGTTLRVPQAYCYRCPLQKTYPECKFACVDFAKQIIERGATEPPMAMIMEPLQGNGGMVEFPDGYLPAVRTMCDELGMLLIFDEIQTGFGRMGEWFAADLYHTVPDILVFGKGIGGGFPLFGDLYSRDIKGFEQGDHSFTFAHFPPSMIAALTTIQVIEEENLLENSRKMGRLITGCLRDMQNRYELIGDIRGPGLMIGIELVKNRATKEPARTETHQFIAEGLKRGVIFGEAKYKGLGNIVKIKPPLIITENEAYRVLEVFEDIVKQLSK